MTKGTGPDRDRSLRTPGPWETWQDPIDDTWRIIHRHRPDNSIIVAIVADEGDAKLICEAIINGCSRTMEPAAWIVHAESPFVTMDPPVEGGLPRTPLYRCDRL